MFWANLKPFVLKATFYFGLANEKPKKDGFTTTKKLRVVLAREDVLKEALDFLERGERRARSHCRVVLPLIHFLPDSLTYSVPLFLKRQCGRTQANSPSSA
jgi:hypothetical protein